MARIALTAVLLGMTATAILLGITAFQSAASDPDPFGHHEDETVAQGSGASPSEVPDSTEFCRVQLPSAQHRGMCFAHNWQHNGSRGYGSETALRSLEELNALGVDWISITPFGYQASVEGTEIQRVNWPASETDSRLRETVEQAHALGLRVMMKPHIWISYSAWRGEIQPAGDDGWERWFESYTTFISGYARLSEEIGADMLVIGVELVSSTRQQPERWRALISHVRTIYSGPLVYAANWDEAQYINFWDVLDYIGVQLFAPIAVTQTDSVADMTARAAALVEQYRVLSVAYDRPVLLTEVGFKSIEGTAISPWDWPEHLPEGHNAADQQAQADAYCAILTTFGQADFIAGMYWWKWFTDPDTDEEGPVGFSPRGKLAEILLQTAFSR